VNARGEAISATAGDLLALTKPRLSGLVLATAAGGMWLAPGGLSAARALLTLVSVAAVVGAANALNCFVERDVDRLMARTRNRPLPAGRMEPSVALWFGISLAAVALPAIALGANLLTATLAAVALLTYVFLYTPLKPRSALAMWVGAIPGALPPLMGWTAVTGRIDAPGLVLFGILFLWQIPHFLAIALFRRDEYAAAGLRTFPVERGDAASRVQIAIYGPLLVALSLTLVPLHVAGLAYGVVAAALGAAFAGYGVFGWLKGLGPAWAKRHFALSLVYLTGIFLALAVDVRLR
jgi:protoheme IX farnesyltransferase